MDWTLDLLAKRDVTFLRVPLQDTGRGGMAVLNAPDDAPYQANIWAEGSPYIAAAREADRQLGRFVDRMQALGRWESTLFIFMADGQGNAGWHLPMDEDSWRTPMLFVGPGVAPGRTISYAEILDVAPTIAHAMQVDPPNPGPGSGRVLREVFADYTGAPPDPPKYLLRFNEQIKKHLVLQARLRLLSLEHPGADNALMQAANAFFLEEPFYGLDRIDEWKNAGSIPNLIKYNERALTFLREALARYAHQDSIPGNAGE